MSKINPLLTIDQLSANIGRQQVLSNISFDIAATECVAIVGGSGAGKSCLLRCVMGLYKPALPIAGSLQFKERHYNFAKMKVKPKHKVHSQMAFVPQNSQAGLDPLKTIASQWRQALRCAGKSQMLVQDQKELLDSLGLPWFDSGSSHSSSYSSSNECRDYYPHEWSQGMQQRLLIAFALLATPELLILDEPTSALDPLIAAKTMTHIIDYAKHNGIAVLIVTHDLALAARFAQRVAIMSHGEMIEFGEAGQILTAPQTEYGKLLVDNRDW